MTNVTSEERRNERNVRNVRLELASCEPTVAVAKLVERSYASRVVRGVTAWLGCWAIGAACIFIPILHFVLVPGFLVAGVVLGALRLREDVTLAEIRGACPRCKSERTYAVGGRFTEGRTVHCDGCGNAFSVVTTPAS